MYPYLGFTSVVTQYPEHLIQPLVAIIGTTVGNSAKTQIPGTPFDDPVKVLAGFSIMVHGEHVKTEVPVVVVVGFRLIGCRNDIVLGGLLAPRARDNIQINGDMNVLL